MNKLLHKINLHANSMDYPYKGYAIFQLISNPIYYIIWVYFIRQGYESLSIRAGIVLLCIPLLFVEIWPKRLIKFLPLYWYFTAFYSLIFFFTFMLLKNHLSYEWSLGALTGVVLWILLLDYKSLFILTPPGIVTGLIIYYLTTRHTRLPYENFKAIIMAYTSIVIFGIIFSLRNTKITDEKVAALKSLAGFIAHELRTPLGSIRMYTNGIREYLRGKSIGDKISIDEHLLKVPAEIDHEIKHSLSTINIVLINLSDRNKNINLETIDAMKSILNAIQLYPLTQSEKNLIKVHTQENFKFKGNKTLFTNVIFNLLKNALYSVADANKGEITIWLEPGIESNKIHFKDTGKGMSKEVQNELFKPFFSKTKYGTGLGLAFCDDVIRKFNGKIDVESKLGEFTIFTLSFPIIRQNR